MGKCGDQLVEIWELRDSTFKEKHGGVGEKDEVRKEVEPLGMAQSSFGASC